MILIDETQVTIGTLCQLGNDLGWNIQDRNISVEEMEIRLEEFLDSVRISKNELKKEQKVPKLF